MRTKTHLAAAVIAVIASNGARAGELSIDFDQNNFDGTPTANGASIMSMISNPYWPLSPDATYKRTFTYLSGDDEECVVNKIEVDPTAIKDDFAAPYDTIRAQIVLDREWVVELGEGEECSAALEVDDEDLAERTHDWYAQDIYWNIWYLGEFSRAFDEEGCPGAEVDDADTPAECFEGSWEAGQYGPEMELVAQPGIVVPSDNPLGNGGISPGTSYHQEFAEGAEDQARILRQHAALSVDDGILPGEYTNCRLAKEWTALEPGSTVEHKWYCADGPGLVLIQGIGGGPTESEVLVEVEMTVAVP
jgi:hypothetical protein